MDNNAKAIIQTLLYSDLFEFPLRKKEIWRFLKSQENVQYEQFITILNNPQSPITTKDGYFFLIGREHIVKKRKQKKAVSVTKYNLAKKVARYLSFIPTIQFIGITGSLALHNADTDDDIDFFIITRHKTMWITRLMTLFVLEVLNVRRKKNKMYEKNTVCLNMLLDEKHLLLPKKRHDVYTAHEIAQINPLINKDNTYQAFLTANSWIETCMPNVLPKNKVPLSTNNKKTYAIRPLELLAKCIQQISINNTKTTETISDTLLAFHPYDYRKKSLALYTKKLKQFNL